jgi:phosphoribosyl 1,2-cyclic phosphodiesterase/ActR/RegA family two-component response regulator
MNRVLIIDDDAMYLKVMEELLQHNGWQVLLAQDGDAGIKLAREHQPCVILLDLLMPGTNGFQVCRTLRSDPKLHEVRIVVMSGRQFGSDRQAAFDAGANHYLVKPIKSEELLRSLSAPVSQVEPGGELSSAADSGTRVTFWGVRGSIPTPGPGTVRYGGNTTCVEVRAAGQIVILDAGTGLRLLGRQLTAEFNGQPLNLTLLLTHTHWDHIQGLPFFLPAYEPRNRLRILGYEGARHGLENVLASQMESPVFPVDLRELPANLQIEELKELNFAVGQVRVQACFANHPGVCVGYRLFTPAGSIAFFPDNESYMGHRHGSKSADEGDTSQRAFARWEEKKLTDFLRGVDMLIMDTQYKRNEYAEHVGWGHGCLDDVVALAIQAEVKRLFLFHHDPDHDDATIDAMVAHAQKLVADRKATMRVEAAREGATVELPYPSSV